MVDEKTELRVWHISQVGNSPSFYVRVSTIREGVKVMNILANYDSFQFENNIKPDYSNAQGLQILTEGRNPERDDAWDDWEIDDESLGYYDDPEEYIEVWDMLEFNS